LGIVKSFIAKDGQASLAKCGPGQWLFKSGERILFTKKIKGKK
jgi:hypothetical protein